MCKFNETFPGLTCYKLQIFGEISKKYINKWKVIQSYWTRRLNETKVPNSL
jgi:hypothetical protein